MFPLFPPEFIYAGTILSAIAGVVLGVYFYLKGRVWPGVLWFVAYCAGLLALYLVDLSGIESPLAMVSVLTWLSVTFGMATWSQRRQRRRSAGATNGA